MVEQKAEITRTIPFEFTGNEGEYFRIWIVNISLTIVTLGVYSAWAKVRKKRYFYGNTLLQGSSFEYLGDPIKILKGRFVVLGILVAYFLGMSILPGVVEVISWLLFFVILPWLVVRARTFNARNSSYRNIRFNFGATYQDAFGVFFGHALLASVTGGLWYPYFASRRSEFLVSRTRYGTKSFEFLGSTKVETFYATYIKAVVLFVVLFFLVLPFVFLVLNPIIRFINPFPQDPEGQVEPFNIFVGFLPIFLAMGLGVFLPTFAYVKTRITNFVLSSTFIGKNHFASSLMAVEMIWLYLSNAVAILASLGLLIPWASIRMARYRLNNIKLLAAGDLDEFTASQQDKVGAAGEEISDFFDLDVGL